MTNYFGGVSEEKILSLEILVYDVLTSLTNANIFAVFTYTDTSGTIRVESTINYDPLTVSTAVWDASLYGPVNFNKHKLELTTKYSVQNGSLIKALVFCNLTPPDTNTFNFINPEIIVT
jgi:hypothetical protein